MAEPPAPTAVAVASGSAGTATATGAESSPPPTYYAFGRSNVPAGASDAARDLVERLSAQLGVPIAKSENLTQQVSLVVNLCNNPLHSKHREVQRWQQQQPTRNGHIVLLLLNQLEAWVASEPQLQGPARTRTAGKPAAGGKRKERPAATPVSGGPAEWGDRAPVLDATQLEQVRRVVTAVHLLAVAPLPQEHARALAQRLEEEHLSRFLVPDWLEKRKPGDLVRLQLARPNACCQLLLALRCAEALNPDFLTTGLPKLAKKLQAAVDAISRVVCGGAAVDCSHDAFLETVRMQIAALRNVKCGSQVVEVLLAAMVQPCVHAAVMHAPPFADSGPTWLVGVGYAFGRPDLVRLVKRSCAAHEKSAPPKPLCESYQYSLETMVGGEAGPWSCRMLQALAAVVGIVLPKWYASLAKAPPTGTGVVQLAASLRVAAREPLQLLDEFAPMRSKPLAVVKKCAFDKQRSPNEASRSLVAAFEAELCAAAGQARRCLFPNGGQQRCYAVPVEEWQAWREALVVEHNRRGALLATAANVRQRVLGMLDGFTELLEVLHHTVVPQTHVETKKWMLDRIVGSQLGVVWPAHVLRPDLDLLAKKMRKALMIKENDDLEFKNLGASFGAGRAIPLRLLKEPTEEHKHEAERARAEVERLLRRAPTRL